MGNTTSRIDASKKDLDSKILLISRKQVELGEKIKHHKKQARTFKHKGDRSQAVMHLKLCHSNKSMLEKLITMKGNMISIKDNLDMSELMGMVISSMKQSLGVLSAIASGQDIQSVNDLMNDFNDLSQRTDEIGHALGQGGLESSDVEEEYDQLEAELLDLPSISHLPNIENLKKDDNRQLEALLE